MGNEKIISIVVKKIVGIISLIIAVYLTSKWFNIEYWKMIIIYFLFQFSANLDNSEKFIEKE